MHRIDTQCTGRLLGSQRICNTHFIMQRFYPTRIRKIERSKKPLIPLHTGFVDDFLFMTLPSGRSLHGFWYDCNGGLVSTGATSALRKPVMDYTFPNTDCQSRHQSICLPWCGILIDPKTLAIKLHCHVFPQKNQGILTLTIECTWSATACYTKWWIFFWNQKSRIIPGCQWIGLTNVPIHLPASLCSRCETVCVY
jgi:hypothetical protein